MTRLDGLDAARYLAFCGMVLVNFRIVAEVAPGADWASTLISALEGRAAALFVMLAGIGVSLSRIGAGLLLRRAAFLLALGMVNMTIFEADILHFYALYFVVGAAFLTAPPRTLWAGALGIVLSAFIAVLLFNYDAGWDWEALTYSDLWTLPGFLRNALFNGWHPVLPWAAFLLIGMAIGRSDLRQVCTQHRLILWGLAAALVALVPQYLTQEPELAAYLGTESIPPGPFYILAGSGTACVTIGLTLKLWPLIERLRLGRVLTAPGRQALTLYVAHILIGMGTLDALGLLDGALTAPQIVAIALGFCALCSVYAIMWQKVFPRGPLEGLMRWVTEPRRAG
ncbi:DUF418 domain-containing protein [Ruegeria sp. 2012CJ41-6]|uniref:DUF418 domain-containing protein n=1 Tax=Ruegeria spongiae TaxID=2942209 RepID=A0ABT0Q669_9RHOB|nr:DUF418 domain-containing protein [Ruegeria spongiae]MCL6285315.1 DUF418 domain-containing protein [Ruegeria spongiae]